jgi:hypothetical protein
MIEKNNGAPAVTGFGGRYMKSFLAKRGKKQKP